MVDKELSGNSKKRLVYAKIKLFDPMTLKIDSDDVDYLEEMYIQFTRRAKNFQFVPAYKAGHWDGYVHMIDQFRATFPYGILLDYIRIHKKQFPHCQLEIEPEVKKIFKGKPINVKYDLELPENITEVRPYQKDCIEAALKYSKGIIRSATASGKSLVISYIIHNLLKANIAKKSLIIVPTTSLITQFFQDLIDYSFDQNRLGVVFSKRKQWDREIVISTWQSLSKNHDKLEDFDCVIVDETHSAKAHEIKKILQNVPNAQYRIGFTGTLHASELDNWNTKAYLGPIIREYPAGLLAEQGYISKATINMIHMKYRNKDWSGSYHDVRDSVFRHPFRLNLIKGLAKKVDHNVLLLVDKVEKEGELLLEYLKKDKDFNKELMFLSGKDDVGLREEWRHKCMKHDNIVLIATYGIFQMGINIPNLKYIILAAPFKAKIRILQSIGRSLRKHTNKIKSGALIFDIVDHTKFFKKYGDIRYRYYEQEKFEIEEETAVENSLF